MLGGWEVMGNHRTFGFLVNLKLLFKKFVLKMLMW